MPFTKKNFFHIKNISLPREWLTYTIAIVDNELQDIFTDTNFREFFFQTFCGTKCSPFGLYQGFSGDYCRKLGFNNDLARINFRNL